MMDVVVEPAKSGDLSARVGSVRIHSAYDPKHEASRFLDKQNLEIRPGATIIIVGDGLGYIDTELKRRRPDVVIIAFHLFSELAEKCINTQKNVLRWNPDTVVDMTEFIRINLSELDITGLRILKWLPSLKAAPEMAVKVEKAIAAVVRRHSGNITTTAVFGKKWIQNTLRNFADIDHIIKAPRQSGTTLIAASGPSLENALDVLKSNRHRYSLWALPSALPALASADIRPDMIFASDPGFWARIHWRYFPKDIPVAMPLSAAPSLKPATATLLLSHGIPGENELLIEKEWNNLSIPQVGSVAITAIETWRCKAHNPLILVGLDLAWSDIRNHCRPHSFDGWLSTFDCRLKPSLTSHWERALTGAPRRIGAFRTGASLTTYSDWFQSNKFLKPVYRFRRRGDLPSPISLANINEINETEITSLPEHAPPLYEKRPAPLNRKKRIERIRRTIKRWVDMIEHSDSINDLMNNNLVYTLDPGAVLDLKRLGKTAQKTDCLTLRDNVQGILADLASTYE